MTDYQIIIVTYTKKLIVRKDYIKDRSRFEPDLSEFKYVTNCLVPYG